jgi:hypothetical protein
MPHCRTLFAPLAALLILALSGSGMAAADPIPPGAVAEGVQAIGYSNLQDRPGFKMSILRAGDRWYLYLGHFWHSGWTIVDVTDPAKPAVVKFVPGPDNTWTLQMEIAENRMITALEKIPPGWGGDPAKPNDEGVLIWDLSDPVNPKPLGQYRTGGTGTHRNFYAGGQYMHLAAGMPGYQGNIYVIVDISDPAHPVEAGRWWVPGQKDGEQPPTDPAVSLHGPAEVVGNTVYLPYGSAGMIVLDISDVSKPKPIGKLDFAPPFNPNIAVHSIVPVPERKLAYVNSEAIQENCQEPLNHASIVDIADPARPRLEAMLPLPQPPAGRPFSYFCEHGGRFGPHNQNQLQHNPFVEKPRDRLYLSYFGGGLRIFDVATPSDPREIASFLPPDPTRRYGPLPKTLVVQSEDILVDTRGYIYLTHKNQGLWILKSTEKP